MVVKSTDDFAKKKTHAKQQIEEIMRRNRNDFELILTYGVVLDSNIRNYQYRVSIKLVNQK